MKVGITLALDILAVINLLIIIFLTFGKIGIKKNLIYDISIIVLLMLVADIVYTAFYGMVVSSARMATFISKTIYFMLNTLVIWRWVRLAGFSIWKKPYKDRFSESVFKGVLFANLALCVINVFYPVLFIITKAGKFSPVMPGMWIFTILNYISVVIMIASSVVNRKKMRRSEYIYLVLFQLPPLVAELVTVGGRTIGLVCAYSVAAIMMIHMSDLDASYTDALTGLGNRRLLEEKLDKWFADSSERIICGVMLSVENLRDINYHVGRAAGDETLCNIAKLFENLSNSHILTVRYDSNRFANVWTAKSPEEAEQISSEIERLVTGYNMSQPSQSKVHFTLGSYGCSNKDTTKDEFVSIGDNSRYKMRKELDMIIDRALRENRFSVFYQPIWSINENRFICAEALLRLEDDEIGHYPPSAIIPAAEKSGAIIRIGEYVLNEVCRFMKSPEFERLGLDFMEINLSVVECMQENLTDSIIETLDSYGIPHNMLNVEITETALLSNKETVQQNLKRLAEEGVTVSLDDYGSGYSNLQRLAQIHFDIVKIDKGVSDNIADETMQIVVRNTIETFKELDLQVVAEGVETKKQLDIYSKFGCDYIQGYYFSKALPKDKFISFIEERNHG